VRKVRVLQRSPLGLTDLPGVGPVHEQRDREPIELH
jgi:hypothetical protein